MAAASFHEAIQLHDEELARLAPFPVLTKVRQRSSSLVTHQEQQHNYHTSHVLLPDSGVLDEGVDYNADDDNDQSNDDNDMPSILSKVLLHKSSNSSNLSPSNATSPEGAGQGKLKITEKGRERRISAGNWRARVLSLSNAQHQLQQPSSPTLQEPPSAQSQFPSPRASTSNIVKQELITSLTGCSASPSSPSPPFSAVSAPPDINQFNSHDYVTSGNNLSATHENEQQHQQQQYTHHNRQQQQRLTDIDDIEESPSASDTSITQQRARAYAALTGGVSRESRREGLRSANLSPSSLENIARASLSSPSLPSTTLNYNDTEVPSNCTYFNQHHYQPLTALSPNLLPASVRSPILQRRRTTSNNDAPMKSDSETGIGARRIGGMPAAPAHIHPNKTPRRSRVQSASAMQNGGTTSKSMQAGRSAGTGANGPSENTATPTRKKRRSLSQENSLVATRITRAFLIRELGDSAVQRRGAGGGLTSQAWTSGENEQRDLWLALHDGVLLCRLLNQIVPHAILHIDKRDLHSARKANISSFVKAARTHLPLQPHEFFDVDNLYSGSPSGFERVLHTLCAIAEYVSLKQHGLFQTSILEASRSADSLLPSHELLSRLHNLRSPSPILGSPSPTMEIDEKDNEDEHIHRNISNQMSNTAQTDFSSSPVASNQAQAGLQKAWSPPAAPRPVQKPKLNSSSGIKIRSRTTSKSDRGPSLQVITGADATSTSASALVPPSHVTLFAVTMETTAGDNTCREPLCSTSERGITPVNEDPGPSPSPHASLGYPNTECQVDAQQATSSSVGGVTPSNNVSEDARGKRPMHGVYGNNADRRMCESSVEIMTVLPETEEHTLQGHRAASDRLDESKISAGRTTQASDGPNAASVPHSHESTPIRLATGRSYFSGSRGSSSFISDSDTSSSSEFLGLSEHGLPVPQGRGIRLRHSLTQSPGAIGSDILGNNTPRLVRKRLSTDRPVPSRAHSASPTAGNMVSPTSNSNITVPFPQVPPLNRSKTSTGYRPSSVGGSSDLAPLQEGVLVAQSDSPFPQSAAMVTFADAQDEEPISGLPRQQHKRWNSEVYEQPLASSRLLQDASRLRSRHNSFMPASNSNDDSQDFGPPSSPVQGPRRRGPDRRQSMDAARRKLVVREPGKTPITYQLGECIGRGQFGSVYRALNIHTGSVVAVKRIRLTGKSEEEVHQLQKEVDMLKRLAHPSVVKYEGLVRSDHYINIVMEYVENGSLHNTLTAFGILPEALVASYVVKILEGLSYLHSVHVIHRDLKAANILTTKNGNIKLSDFGVSLQLNAVHNTIENADATGTPNWMAPEVIKLEKATFASDIWSLACTVVELLTGKPPYANLLAMTAMFKIVEDDMPPLPKSCSPELRDFLGVCFAKDPRKRPSADTLFQHAWLRKYWNNNRHTLRPQDSIPFLRRISSEYRRPSFENNESTIPESMPDLDRSISSPGNSSLMRDDFTETGSDVGNVTIVEALETRTGKNNISGSQFPIPDLDVITSEMLRQGKEVTNFSVSVPEAFPFAEDNVVSPLATSAKSSQRHSFVKTTFSKPIECKLCHKPVKKYAVLCEDCGLICHATCKEFAPFPCDLRSQLLGLAMPSSDVVRNDHETALAASVPTIDPSPLASPAQFAFHSKFGIGKSRKPKTSPSSDIPSSPADSSAALNSPDSPRRNNKGLPMLRARTTSPDAVGFHYTRNRPPSYASSGSFPRSHDMQASLSSSSDSHPLSSSSIPEEGPSTSPLTISPPTQSQSQQNKKVPLLKHGRSKSARRRSGTECVVS